jgi:hypothetical protein
MDSTEREFELARLAERLYTPGWRTMLESETYHDIEFLHELGKRLSAAPLPQVLAQVVRFVSDFVGCDSCFIYVLDGPELILRASKNPMSSL